MMQKRTLTSLLLISFLVAFAFSYSFANEVTFQPKTSLRCDEGSLDITVDNTVDVAAVEIVFEIATTSGDAYLDAFTVDWDPAFTQLGTRIIDVSQADGVSPDTVRLAALLLDSADVILAAGSHVVAQVDFTTNSSCGGEITLDGVRFNYPIPAPIVTQFVDANTYDIVPVAVNAGVITVQNVAPTLAAISDTTLPWGSYLQIQLVGDDNDLNNPCEKLSYSKVSGPSGLQVNSTTGLLTWNIPGDAVCEHTVEVKVTDSCGASATRSFDICVTNEPPVADSVTQGQPVWAYGDLVSGQVWATDPDEGPNDLDYSVLSIVPNPGNAVMIDPNTGAWTWQTELDPAYTGDFVVTFEVNDGANTCADCSPENADTITTTIRVYAEQICVEYVDSVGFSTTQDVSINMLGDPYTSYPFSAYKLRLFYDATALTFIKAEQGALLDACEWEYFTYRTGDEGCGTGCPTGYINLIAFAETNATGSPSCFAGESSETELARLTFLVTSDLTFECQKVEIGFAWLECGDNTLSSIYGDTLLLSRSITNLAGIDLTDPTADFPTNFGAPEECETVFKYEPWRLVDFCNGGIRIICTGEIDDRGDINVDGLANTVADAVMLTNYLLIGPDAFGDHFAASLAASDINADGLPASVADLVYLVRIIVGDAAPIAPSGFGKITPVSAELQRAGGVLSMEDITLAGARIELAGDVEPDLLATNMVMERHFDGTNTTVVIAPPTDLDYLETFIGEFVDIHDAELVSIDLATAEGAPVNSLVNVLPTEYALAQNYPNPFNPTTTISFALPQASDVQLDIYNVTGQLVESVSGNYTAGTHEIVWDATNVASGVYFYRLVTNDFTQTKKMVLLK
jgi:hypothetical protein